MPPRPRFRLRAVWQPAHRAGHGNPLDQHTTRYGRGARGEVLMRDERPRDIWDQHEALLGAVIAGDAKTAEKLARQHIEQAADFMIKRLGSGSSA